MKKIPTAEEIFYNIVDYLPVSDASDEHAVLKSLRLFAKLHVKAALKAASEKAQVGMNEGGASIEYQIEKGYIYVRPEEILNAYPITNIV